jgi:hypothetical protein
MRANRVRMLASLATGGTMWCRGRTQMVEWFRRHGLIESAGTARAITAKGKAALTEAVADYDTRGRLREVFQ